MAKEFKHYGNKVIFQQLEDQTYVSVLKKNGIEYTELPIIDNRVYLYYKDKEKTMANYAVVVPVNGIETYLEDVYVTDSIPVDMDWSKLVDDINRQRLREEPMELKTKARVLCEYAEEFATVCSKENFFESKIDPALFRRALANKGYSIEEVLEMEHHDVNEDFLKSFIL